MIKISITLVKIKDGERDKKWGRIGMKLEVKDDLMNKVFKNNSKEKQFLSKVIVDTIIDIEKKKRLAEKK